MNLTEYMQAFDQAERDFEAAVESFGLPFEQGAGAARDAREHTAAACGCRCENGSASLWRNWISPACLACRTGEETATFFIDLRCTKSCYFCFNPNQDHYEYFLSHRRDIVAELEQAHAAGAAFRCLAVTGGEPMLHADHVNAFLRRAAELYPQAHTRLYTSGDLLDQHGLEELAKNGLDEIRFSIKPPDSCDDQQRVYDLMEQAVGVVPAVVVEVPVIPGSLEPMKELLRRSNAIGINGVNLLEFCFPLHNAEEFARHGFSLRRRPFKHLYNYWYGGGIPVAESEAEALALLEFAEREGLGVGVHYCSSDNKNTGQIYQQNRVFFADASLRAAYPWLCEDEGDRFLKCVKVFGDDALQAKVWAGEAGVAYGFDADVPSIALSHEDAVALRVAHPGMALAESANVFEEPEGAAPQSSGVPYLREVSVAPL